MIYVYIFYFELDQSEVKIFNLHLLILNQLSHVQKTLFFLLVYFYLFNDLIQMFFKIQKRKKIQF